MATLLWQRDIGSDINSVKSTYSSWDACMSKTYCKWPVIIGIIIVASIVLSLLWCVARCLCCGVECCCGCLSCCNSCCPSPRRRRDQGYQQAPPTPYYNPNPYQYQSSPMPVYASGGMGYRGVNDHVPQTATFETPNKYGARFNEDALPAMPSWDTAPSRREEVFEDVEMEKLDTHNHTGPQTTQQESLLARPQNGRLHGGGGREATQELPPEGDMGGMNARPYHDYQQPERFSPSPYGSQNHGIIPTASPQPYGGANSDYYARAQQLHPAGADPNHYGTPDYERHGQQSHQRAYEPSIPPSYHTAPPSAVVSPISPSGRQAQQQYPGQQMYQAYGGAGRKPVQGSWREV